MLPSSKANTLCVPPPHERPTLEGRAPEHGTTRIAPFASIMYELDMKMLAASEVRESFAEILNRVAYQGERVVMHRRGKPVAALVPLEDLATLEALENERDLAAARKALREKGSVPIEKLKAELGL